MKRTKREAFTPGVGVMDIIENFMKNENYSCKSQAINRIIINFGRVYANNQQQTSNQGGAA